MGKANLTRAMLGGVGLSGTRGLAQLDTAFGDGRTVPPDA
jgi:hypothetical protein